MPTVQPNDLLIYCVVPVKAKGVLLQHTSDYYRFWGWQLSREFQAVCYQYSLSLQPPAFTITESKTQYGSWWPSYREIRISSVLIRWHSWDVTLQVLKHEIAHQICSEIFHNDNGGHGEDFIKACNMIGLPSPFRHSHGDLPQKIDMPGDERTSCRIIEKIRKLLALAGSSNVHEARLAMETAGRLLKKHNLNKIREQEEYIYAIINGKRKRIEQYQRRIIMILTKFFFVKALYSSMYDPLANETYKTFEIYGRKENVEIAEYCYYFLENKLPLLWRRNRLDHRGNIRIAKKSYYLGLLQGFHDRLLAQEVSTGKGDKGIPSSQLLTDSELMIADDLRLQHFIHARYPRLSKRSTPGVKIYRDIFDTGVKTGRDLIFHKGIEADHGNEGKVLE